MNDKNNSGSGPLIGSIIVVLLIIAGGYYSWTSRPASNDVPIDQNIQVTVDSGVSTSTELKDIEADASDTTSLDNLGSDLDAAEAEVLK